MGRKNFAGSEREEKHELEETFVPSRNLLAGTFDKRGKTGKKKRKGTE